MNSIVALPILAAMPTVAPGMFPAAGLGSLDPAISAAAETVDAFQRFEDAACRVSDAEGIMDEWLRRNPRPEMRATAVGSNADYDAFQAGKSSYDPNADLRAAISEHGVAVQGWSKRKRIAETQSGLVDAEATKKLLKARYDRLAKDLESVRPTSLDGLVAKARAIRSTTINLVMAYELANDVVEMFENSDADKLRLKAVQQ